MIYLTVIICVLAVCGTAIYVVRRFAAAQEADARDFNERRARIEADIAQTRTRVNRGLEGKW